MAQRSNFQIDDIKINKRGNAFFMDIDATLDEPNQIRKLNISDVELCNDGTLELKESKLPFDPLTLRCFDAMVGHIKLSDGVIRQFGNIDIKVIKKPHPEISIEEAERLLKCRIVRE